MNVLIAEDDVVTMQMLDGLLRKWGYVAVPARDGEAAWRILSEPVAPRIAILDWNMPGIDGVELCRRVRKLLLDNTVYLMLLTAREGKADLVTALEAGANDYITKPFDSDELCARLQVARRMVELQQMLELRVADLQAALAQVHRLEGLLPMCAKCRRIRDKENSWMPLENYLHHYSDARITHGLCPQCLKEELADNL